jgi:hypothetical protein
MSEPYKTPPPRRTIALTIAGFLLLLPAAASVLMAITFGRVPSRNVLEIGVAQSSVT